jgi:putative acyl-CoA dehydrogenase
MPRVLPGGQRNAIRINRLKDKLGNRSNASAEVEFERALAYAVGPEDRGIATILEMVQYTRLDCVIGSAGIIRAALTSALHHARQRMTFGRHLVEHPLMINVLADIALESEAAMLVALLLARTVETSAATSLHAAARIVTPAAKYWLCKRAIAVTAEAMEALGGNGYVEECPLPRLYREAPVNSIWEGSGNIVCLDVARAIRREPEAVDALLALLAGARGVNVHYDRHVAQLETALRTPVADGDGRRLAQAIALAVSAAQMVEHAPGNVADAFCASRLVDDTFRGAAFGTLADTSGAAQLLERALA